MTYPTEKVVGIAPDAATLRAVRDELARLEVPAPRVEILCGVEARGRLRPGTDDTGGGALDRLVRTVQKVLGDETGRLERLEAAIENGEYVVEVTLPDGDDDAAREQAKQAIGHTLVAAGATSVAFFGQWRIEELQTGAWGSASRGGKRASSADASGRRRSVRW